MPSFRDAARSSVGKKLISGLTGLLLCGFVASHLVGNLLLLVGADAFNEYAHFLETLGHGYAIYGAEAGLIAFFVFHIVSGVMVALDRRRARPSGYKKRGNAGGASRKTLASRSMIITGVVLLVFLVLHVWMFKYGPGIEAGYTTTLDGETHRDLYRLVVEWFKIGPVTAVYVAVMLLLGNHLRHGFWSAWQSLGVNSPKYMPLIHRLGIAFALLIALGFLLIPVLIYLLVDPASAGLLAAG